MKLDTDAMRIMSEDVISLADAAKEFPANARPNHSTVFRWTTKGVGGVKLEAVKLSARQRFTSKQSVTRFITSIQK